MIDPFGSIGRKTIDALTTILDLNTFLLDAIWTWLTTPGVRRRIGYSPAVTQIVDTGVQALPLATLLALLTGFIVTYRLIALTDVVGTTYVTDVLIDVVGMELGPIIAAIVLISRSGSAIAVDVANMKLHAEIDTLVQLGIDLRPYMIAPRLLGAAVAQFALAVYFTGITLVSGILLGGFLLSSTDFNYLYQIVDTFEPIAILAFVLKTLAFGLLSGAAACFYGLQARTSYDEVSVKMQSAIVTSLLLVFLTDGLFAVSMP